MNVFVRSIWTVPTLLLVALATSLGSSGAADIPSKDSGRAPAAEQHWTAVSIEMPTRESTFPPGEGVELTGQCLICHSAGMVLRQPPLTRDEWIGEIDKMRGAFGAPLPADQVQSLADYLHRINGRTPGTSHTAVESQGS